MDIDFEQLKRQWAEQSARIERLEAQNEKLRHKLSSSSNMTLRDKLIRDYKIFLFVSIILVPITFSTFPLCDFPWMMTVSFALLFALESIANGYILKLLKDIDFTSQTTREALTRVIHLQKSRSRLQIIFITLTIPVLTYGFYVFGTIDKDMIWSGLLGGIFGGIIGAIKDRQIRQIIRRMKAELEEMDREE
ncbi:MAG: hypothetical protein K2I64_06420 [Muribaculaceae bacterium]|nr:hypothetical protein [Muribaculaceae bacterium]